MRFHHIGYAVQSIEQYLEEFLRPLFAPACVSTPVADPIQKVRVCFVEMQGGTLLELVEPVGNGHPLSSIIGSNRGGVYHVCHEVDDLEAEIARFRAKRCMPLAKPVPAAAFNGRRIVFLLTPQRDLIELLEASTEGFHSEQRT